MTEKMTNSDEGRIVAMHPEAQAAWEKAGRPVPAPGYEDAVWMKDASGEWAFFRVSKDQRHG